MSAIPKPLLVVVIVLLVLGVASCALGLGGGRDRCNPDTDAGCKDKQKTELSGDAITDLLRRLVPPPAKVELGPADADCFAGGQTNKLAFAASCEVRIQATGDSRRRLRMTAAAGTVMSVRFIQDRGGEHFDDTQNVPFSDSGGTHDAVEVTLGRDESAVVELGCFVGCTVTLD